MSTYEQRKKLAILYPEMASQLTHDETKDTLGKLLASVSLLRGEKGDSIIGEKGDKGERGEKGEKGDTGKKGESIKGDKGDTGLRGPRGYEGINGNDGRDGKDGKNAPKVNIDKLIEPINKKIDDISNTINAKGKIDQRWHGAGLSKVSTDTSLTGNGTPSNPLSVVGGGGLNVETPTGTVDGVNITFSVLNTPIMLIWDGLIKVSGINYSYSAPTITVTDGSPPVQFIRSLYF